MKLLDILIGAKVKKTEEVYDYVQLYFDDESILNIYNRFTINDKKNQKISTVLDLIVIQIIETEDIVTLNFSSNRKIAISLKDEDYSGPEALELIDPNGQIAIWP